MVWKELCTSLSERLKAHGVEKTGGEVWCISPHGELWPIAQLEEQLNSIDRAVEANHPKATPEFIKQTLEKFFTHHNNAERL